jgi:Secretion system C-terminal sorting domain
MKIGSVVTAILTCVALVFSQTPPPYHLNVVAEQTGTVSMTWEISPAQGLIENFDDDFAQDFNWYTPNGDNTPDYGHFQINSGYAQVNSGTDFRNWASGYYEELEFQEFICELSIENISGRASRGILFRGDGFKDEDFSGYAFMLGVPNAGLGDYAVWRWSGGSPGSLIYWTESASINNGLGATNNLKVIGQGPNFDFYINDIYVNSVTNTLYPSGFVGFTGAESVIARIDNVTCSHVAELMPRHIEPEHGERVDAWLDEAGNLTNQPPLIAESEPFVETENTRYLDLEGAIGSSAAPIAGYKSTQQYPVGQANGGMNQNKSGQTTDELDEFDEYRIYRDGMLIGTSTSETFTDQLPAYGEYEYRVTAYYDPEGESIPSVAAIANWDAVTYGIVGQNTIVPYTGGIITYDVQLFSELAQQFPNVSYRTYVTAPDQTIYGPTFQYNFTLAPFMSVMQPGLQVVPAFAPPGDYVFYGRLYYQGAPVMEQSFDFDKMGGGELALGGGEFHFDSEEWATGSGVSFADQANSSPADGTAGLQVAELPDEFRIDAAYPNPFNAMTTIRVVLPEAADLKVTVFNVTGQEVAELANGQFSAGQHNFVFDGAGLSSGIYFIHANVAGQLNEIQKVTLMK